MKGEENRDKKILDFLQLGHLPNRKDLNILIFNKDINVPRGTKLCLINTIL